MTTNLSIQMLPLHSTTLCKNCNQITIASAQFIKRTYTHASNTVKPANNGNKIICTFVGLKFLLFQLQRNLLSDINFRTQRMEQNYLNIKSNFFLLNALYSVLFLFKKLLFIADNFALDITTFSWPEKFSDKASVYLVEAPG
jgi:hypothetical protein